jgi:hypothetical protein
VTAPARLSLFALLLIAVFAGAALLGGAVDPSGSDAGQGHAAEGDSGSAEHAGGHRGEAERSEATLPGLAVAQNGYRLVLKRSTYERSARPQRFGFRIVDDAGRPVRDFEVEHGKRMHFIVVRRDSEDFQHLHPQLRDDGTWTQRVTLARGGNYRVFTDFTRDGRQRTLGADVQVAGAFRPERLPRPERTVRSDGGLRVTLRAGDVSSGSEGRVAFDVRDRGRLAGDHLEPYLGAKGHLVALRQGDLAYLHTHPEGDELAFETTYPSAGAYRLFVQFSYNGRVHTAAFTQRVSS